MSIESILLKEAAEEVANDIILRTNDDEYMDVFLDPPDEFDNSIEDDIFSGEDDLVAYVIS